MNIDYIIKLEDFEEEPLILKPFEVYRNHYDPISLFFKNHLTAVVSIID